jgi:hypothetical protein
MKKTIIITIILAAVLVLVFVVDNGFTKERKSAVFTDDSAYTFPVRPGMKEWKKLPDHGEMLAAVQIPNDKLKRMTTRALVETCLDYPMYGEITVYNSWQEGLEALISGFNGLRELMRRRDAGTELLKQYQLTNQEITEEIKAIEAKKSNQTDYYSKHVFLETLLARENVLSALSENEKTSLLAECFKNFYLHRSRPEIYSFSSLQSEVLLMKRILEREGVVFASSGKTTAEEEMGLFNNKEKIISGAEKFLSKQEK